VDGVSGMAKRHRHVGMGKNGKEKENASEGGWGIETGGEKKNTSSIGIGTGFSKQQRARLGKEVNGEGERTKGGFESKT